MKSRLLGLSGPGLAGPFSPFSPFLTGVFHIDHEFEERLWKLVLNSNQSLGTNLGCSFDTV